MNEQQRAVMRQALAEPVRTLAEPVTDAEVDAAGRAAEVEPAAPAPVDAMELLIGLATASMYPRLVPLVAWIKAQPAVVESGWISVDESLPECNKTPNSLGVHVLVYPPYSSEGVSEFSAAFYGCRQTDEPNFYLFGRCFYPTHWMPLPPPPAATRRAIVRAAAEIERIDRATKGATHE